VRCLTRGREAGLRWPSIRRVRLREPRERALDVLRPLGALAVVRVACIGVDRLLASLRLTRERAAHLARDAVEPLLVERLDQLRPRLIGRRILAEPCRPPRVEVPVLELRIATLHARDEIAVLRHRLIERGEEALARLGR